MVHNRSHFQPFVLLFILPFLFIPSFAFGWGNAGHIAINRAAALGVPKSMPDFLRAASERIAYIGPEPDRWREKTDYSLKNSQEPDHFIDLERLNGFPELPKGRYEFYQLLFARRATAIDNPDNLLPEKVGLQPYITIEIFERLRVAFREYRRLRMEKKPTAGVEQNIVFYAGWLGHYVGDISNPLHTTIHYNGWDGPNPNNYTTSHDIHWKFEGEFVNAHIQDLKFNERIKPPVHLDNPFQGYMQCIRDSNKLVERVYQLENVKAFDGNGSPEGNEFIKSRLAAGSQMLVNLWYTAWIDSGVPLPAAAPAAMPTPAPAPPPTATPAPVKPLGAGRAVTGD